MSKKKKIKQAIIIIVLTSIAIGLGVGVGFLAWTIKTTPDISHLYHFRPSEASTIYSADGEVLSTLFIENRIYVPLSRIPMDLQNAIIASEDQRFWEHNGINIWRIMRALYVDMKTRSKAEGASTITQQLARELALHQKKLWSRKIQEAYIAIQLERMYTKEEILEMYLNQIFLGHSARGVQTAAQQYFGKNVEDLTLGEAAMIVGIVPSPNRWSPYVSMEAATTRRNLVLNIMANQGYISREVADRTREEPLVVAGRRSNVQEEFAPYFIRHVRDQIIQMYGSDMVYRGGLKIYTTIDTNMQKAAEAALKDALDSERGYIPTINRANGETPLQPQVALITIDPRNGHVKAMIGGRGHDSFNRAIQSQRQPGSAFKPVVYSAALEMGYEPGDVVDDVLGYFDPRNPNPWPTNYNDTYHGPVSLRYAMSQSLNVASVRLLDQIGVNSAIQMAERLQFKNIVKTGTTNDRNLGFALGGLTKGVSPLEIASAYGIFANKGIYVEPTTILRIEDSNGHVLYQPASQKKIILKEDIAFQMTDILRSVVTTGTGRRANIQGHQIAGKTGTTTESRDAWFVGYTPELVTSVWIGEDIPRAMIYDEKDAQGKLINGRNGQPMRVASAEATQLWSDYMRQVLNNRPAVQFERPANIVNVAIDSTTGKLPNAYSPKVVTEIFRAGNEPKEIEQLHQPTVKTKINRVSGLLASAACPTDQVVEYTYQRTTGIRVGPATITRTIPWVADRQTTRRAIYQFEAGVPIIQIDPRTGVPVTDVNKNYLYEYMPTTRCSEHAPSSAVEAIQSGTQKVVDSIWNFLNSGSGN